MGQVFFFFIFILPLLAMLYTWNKTITNQNSCSQTERRLSFHFPSLLNNLKKTVVCYLVSCSDDLKKYVLIIFFQIIHTNQLNQLTILAYFDKNYIYFTLMSCITVHRELLNWVKVQDWTDMFAFHLVQFQNEQLWKKV